MSGDLELPPEGAVAWANFWERTVFVDSEHAFWETVTNLFCDPDATDAQKMCAAIEVASLLLDELLHLCLRTLPTDSDQECHLVPLVANTFRHSMLQRYPDAGAEPCCRGKAGIGFFLSDNTEWMYSLDRSKCEAVSRVRHFLPGLLEDDLVQLGLSR